MTLFIWNTKGQVYTDATNASRTMIFNISQIWDDTILKMLNIKKHILPEVKDCADDIYRYPSFKKIYTNYWCEINRQHDWTVLF